MSKDPRNREHIREAIAIIQKSARVMARTNARKDLTPFGIRLGDLPTGEPRPGEDVCVVGGFFFLEEGLIFRDNEVRRCQGDGCRHVVQFRPGLRPGVRVLCIFCAADEALRSSEKPG